MERFREPLFENSLYLMLTSLSNVGFGFVFWIFAARLYQSEDVGVATVLISSMSLIVLLSRFGLDYSLIRFFPNSNKRMILGTSMIVVTVGAIVLSVVLIAFAGILSDELRLIQNLETSILFITYVTASSIVAIAGNAYVACRKSSRFFAQSLVMGSRIALLFPLVCCDALGIFSSVGLSFILALMVSLVFLRQIGVTPELRVNLGYLSRSFRFSAGNYVTSLFVAAPALIMPIIVLNELGAEDTAFYFIAYSVAALLLIVPNSVSLSLLVEGSHGEALGRILRKALLLITPGVIVPAMLLFVFGDWVLGIYGSDYSENAFELMKLLVIANLLAAYVLVFYAMARIHKNVVGLVVVSGITSVALLLLAFVAAASHGLEGIGYAWIVAYAVGLLAATFMFTRRRMMIAGDEGASTQNPQSE